MRKQEYIKSPINYVENKYKLLPQIVPLFPNNIGMFVDVFGGSGTVLINTKAEYYVYNDINNYVASIFDGLITEDADVVIDKVESIVSEYNLSKTNKNGFKKLRDDYNNGRQDWVTLYTLACYSYNYQIRFNNNHQYNSSFGKERSCFSSHQKANIRKMKKRVNSNIVGVTSMDFADVISKSVISEGITSFDKNDLIYCDCPYLGSVGNYNDSKRGFDSWTERHEIKLLNILDKLNKQGTRFALSNNLKYDNPLLNEWKERYNVHYLNADYTNCNYHKIDRSNGADIEVLITNY